MTPDIHDRSMPFYCVVLRTPSGTRYGRRVGYNNRSMKDVSRYPRTGRKQDTEPRSDYAMDLKVARALQDPMCRYILRKLHESPADIVALSNMVHQDPAWSSTDLIPSLMKLAAADTLVWNDSTGTIALSPMSYRRAQQILHEKR